MRILDNNGYRDMTEEEINEHNKIVEEFAEIGKEQEIEGMKQDLASSDYKIIKCMECFLLGKELPYDIKALYEERQSKRDEINLKEVHNQ